MIKTLYSKSLPFYISSVFLVLAFTFGCNKTTEVTHIKTAPTDTTSKLAFLVVDGGDSLATELWAMPINGSPGKQINLPVPSDMYFDFFNDEGLGILVSPDRKTLQTQFVQHNTYDFKFYKFDPDGNNLKQFYSDSYADLPQCFINNSSVLYWQQDYNAANHGELRKVNTDGTDDQKINISLPSNIKYNQAVFAKVTSDGKNIFFSADVYGDSTITGSKMYEVGTDGSGFKNIVTTTNGNCFNLAAIYNNTLLYYKFPYEMDESPQTLWQMNLDGSNDHQIKISFPAGFNLPNGSFNLTPQTNLEIWNGKLYVVAFDVNFREYIFTADLDGSNVKLFYTAPVGRYIFPGGII